MSIAANAVPGESPERVARLALDSVRRATKASAGRNVIALALVGEENPVEIPAELSDVVLTALTSLADGHQVMVLPRDSELTTVQAAEVLNVSRPHLIKLLDEGDIEYRMVGTHRRVNAGSLLTFKTADDRKRRSAADTLIALSQELGFDQ